MNVQANIRDIRDVEAAIEPDVDLWALADPTTPFALRAAATLRLADLIDGGCGTLEGLAAKTGYSAEMLGRLLRYLACRGIFRETAPDSFVMTKAAHKLKDDHPGMLRAWLDLGGMGGRMDMCFGDLLECLRTGEAAYPKIFGRTMYDDVDADPAFAHSFGVLMANVSSWFAKSVVNLDWSGTNHLVDIAGGTGTLISLVLKANPAMRGTLFDQPLTAPEARENLAAQGLADRCTVVGGSYLDPLPAGGDVYMMSQIIHNCNDRDAEIVLRRCATAAGPGKRVLVLDRVIGAADDQHIATRMDLRMLVTLGAKERSVPEFEALGAKAGLALGPVTRLKAGMYALDFVVKG